MKLSLITATHDRPETLATVALPSVLSQTNLEFEWVIVNDGRDPQTRQVITALNGSELPQIVYLEREHPNVGFGLGYARNLALQAASGEVIAYLDDDNTIAAEFVAETLHLFEITPELRCSMARQYRVRNVVQAGQVVRSGTPFISPAEGATVIDLINQRSLFDSNGFAHYRQDAPWWNPKYRVFFDYEYFLQCLSVWGEQRFRIHPAVLVRYIQTSAGVIGQSSYHQWADELQQLYQRAGAYPALQAARYEQWLPQLIEKYRHCQRTKGDRYADRPCCVICQCCVSIPHQ